MQYLHVISSLTFRSRLHFSFLPPGYCEHIYKEGDYLLLIHVPETYDFTMA
ncbi:universal stress protein in QAH/OAS sulfhydrylase 3region, partial [Biomphalaria glabrata]